MSLINHRLSKSEKWSFTLDFVTIEIVNHGFEWSDRPDGIWNYYVVLDERRCDKQIFDQHWLKANIVDKRRSFDYYSLAASTLHWHGGITYYEQICTEVGYRALKLGCDFSHYYDQSRVYSLEDIYLEALRTAEEVIEMFKPQHKLT